MISESILGRIIQSAGVEDERIVRIDVISVYLLQALTDAGMFNHMCFKGGNSLRKIFARRPMPSGKRLVCQKLLNYRLNFWGMLYPIDQWWRGS